MSKASDMTFEAENRSSYRRWTREILRYSDLDPVGHVNNNAYGQFVENARTALFFEVDAALQAGKHGLPRVDWPRFDWVVRRIEYDFLREIRYPGEIEVGVVVCRFGTSSMTLRHGVFVAENCAATSIGVSVCFDLDARSAIPIPDPVREALRAVAGI